MTPNDLRKMTHDQRRDWWATTVMGCKHVDQSEFRNRPHWIDSDGEPVWTDDCLLAAHPLPDTLDAIAACLPKGWWWERRVDEDEEMDGWCAYRDGRSYVQAPDTGNEKSDRLLLACLAWLEERGSK